MKLDEVVNRVRVGFGVFKSVCVRFSNWTERASRACSEIGWNFVQIAIAYFLLSSSSETLWKIIIARFLSEDIFVLWFTEEQTTRATFFYWAEKPKKIEDFCAVKIKYTYLEGWVRCEWMWMMSSSTIIFTKTWAFIEGKETHIHRTIKMENWFILHSHMKKFVFIHV